MQPDWWKYIVDIAQILSAIGTCGAVIVALWIASRPPKVHISGWIGLRQIVGVGKYENEVPEYLLVSVTNTGANDLVITGFSWRISKKAKVWAYQMMGHADRFVTSSQLPKKLTHGESADYFLPTFGEFDWFHEISKSDDPFNRAYATQKDVRALRMIVSTSVGVSHSIKPETPVLDRIWANIKTSRQVQI
jgi:hypothetical protein